MKYTHFFWDFDGTLFDTYNEISIATQKALHEFGFELSLEELMPLVKKSLASVFETFAQKANVQKEDIKKMYRFFSKNDPRTMLPYPGALECLSEIVEKGGKNYLYTHRGSSAILTLKHYKADCLFADFITSVDPFDPKPAPDALCFLCKKHALHVDTCIMIGDRNIDIEAGYNAHMHSALFDPEGFYNDYPCNIRANDFTTLKKWIL